jgi:hypothetical protein
MASDPAGPLAAVTATRSVEPTSASDATYVCAVPPSGAWQFAPEGSQRSHWYAKLVGLFVQTPFATASVAPLAGVPLIVGATVFAGVRPTVM